MNINTQHFVLVKLYITLSEQPSGFGSLFPSSRTLTSRVTVIWPCVGPIILRNTCGGEAKSGHWPNSGIKRSFMSPLVNPTLTLWCFQWVRKHCIVHLLCVQCENLTSPSITMFPQSGTQKKSGDWCADVYRGCWVRHLPLWAQTGTICHVLRERLTSTS